MKTPKISFSMRSHLKGKSFLVGAIALFSTVSTSIFAAVDVADGYSGLQGLTNSAANGREFNLLGDVTLTGYSYLNTADLKVLVIEGNGHTITKTDGIYAFWITAAQANASLAIRDAIITTSTNSATRTYGSISVDVGSNNALIDLDGTVIRGNHGLAGTYSGGLTTLASNTQVSGDVSFESNDGDGDGAGAVALGLNASLIFLGKTTFSNNSTVNYGGAVSIREGASLTFKNDALFEGNFATAYFGGAIDMWNGNGSLVFEKDAKFKNNYVKTSFVQTYGARGGAINIGYLTGTGSPQLEMQGVSEFSGNYVWGSGSTVGVGGALALSAAVGDPLSESQISSGFIYGANIAQGVFSNNYAYSDTSGGYGGAVFSKSYNASLAFGSGSQFTGNMAKTLGGAIYFDQGILSLTGNVLFSGNRQGVSFSTAGGVLTPDSGTGSANAIYFAGTSNTVALNLTNAVGEIISFEDPIQSAEGRVVVVSKDGLGKVVFTGHNSDILARTAVSGGIFELGSGVEYGRLGTISSSNFNLAAGATLIGNSGATLIASDINFNGRVQVNGGEFSLKSSGVEFSSTAVLSFVLTDKDNYGSLDVGGQSLELGGASLEIIADGYVPSSDMSDFFTIITSRNEKA